MAIRESLEQSWRQPNYLTVLLWPLSLVYRGLYAVRSLLYRFGVFSIYRSPVPVVVVGNLTVGGTGKTPLTIYLVEQLQRLGYRPGVISRGYGGSATHYPLAVNNQTPVSESGDEPALIVKRTGAPMVVGPDRSSSIKSLLSQADVNIIVSDDGLQHLAMARDIEICLLDITTPNRNSCLLPAGPYRESKARLNSVDLIVCHGLESDTQNQFSMNLSASEPQPVAEERNDMAQALDVDAHINAVAGIGNPQRFFDTCRNLGYRFKEHVFADHYQYTASDIDLDAPVLMTEKDAVKCASFADDRHWYLPVDAKLSTKFATALETALHALKKP